MQLSRGATATLIALATVSLICVITCIAMAIGALRDVRALGEPGLDAAVRFSMMLVFGMINAQVLGNVIGALASKNAATVPDVETLERRVVELEARLRTA